MTLQSKATVHDVARYVLEKTGEITTMKLQKLVYYCQAWSLVWDERPLFPERIEAWANGPAIPDLYEVHRGLFTIAKWPRGSLKRLDADARATIDAVLESYADKPARWLSELAHMEDPWKEARAGLPEGERGHREITLGAMSDYYGSL